MTDGLPDAPPPELRYRRGLNFGPSLRTLWGSRHLTPGAIVRLAPVFVESSWTVRGHTPPEA